MGENFVTWAIVDFFHQITNLDVIKRSFNGEEELRSLPTQLPGVDVLEQLEHLEPVILRKSQKRKREKYYTSTQLEEK